MTAMQAIQERPIIGQYNEHLRSVLTYMNGENFLSQGGPERIDFMIGSLDIAQKKVLDLGCGVGGPTLYVAQQYKAHVFGVDVDPELIKIAQQNKLKSHQQHISFATITPNQLPFDDNSFDVIFSKEAIVHAQHKNLLFKELYRVLKPEGSLIIMDWFKEQQPASDDLHTTLDIDQLVMHYTTVELYTQLLSKAGFTSIEVQETSHLHLADTKKDYQRLITEKKLFQRLFSKKIWEESITCWDAHIKILESKEIKTFLVKARKNTYEAKG